MTEFISNISALQFQISNGTSMRHVYGSKRANALKPARAKPQIGTLPNSKAIKYLGYPEGIYTEKLHVNVATRQDRSRSEAIVSHVWNGPDRGTYQRIDDIYCVMTPEACFAQLAGELSFPHLVELGFMLCGTYAPAPKGNATRYDVPPLTDPEKLQAYIQRLEQKNGLANARAAAKLVTAGSGSEMESKIATMLALTTRRGGMGKPAILNEEVELTDAARGLGYRNIRRPDFLWPQCGVTLDYDSHKYHDTAEALAADEARRNELAALGLKGIVARREHFKNLVAFEALMGQVHSAAGWSMGSSAAELPSKRYELFQQLFGSKQWRPMDIR